MNCFVIYRDKLGNRLDPLYYSQDTFYFFKNNSFIVKTLGEVSLYLKAGFPAGGSMQALNGGGIIQIRPTNIDEEGLLKFDKNIFVNDKTKKSDDFLQKGEVLFNNTNSQELVGKTAFLDSDKQYFCSNHITRIKVDEKFILPKYLWILLNVYQRKKVFYNICTNWNNQSGVNVDLLKTLKIPLPPIETQNRIVSIMQFAYDQKKQKEQNAERLLNSIDDFVLGELGIRLPALQDKKCFIVNSENIEGRIDPYFYQKRFTALINTLLKANHETYTIGDLITDMSGGATPKVEENFYTDENNGIPFLRVQNITKEGLFLEDVKYITEEVHNTMLKRSQLREDDLVFTITGRIGSVALIPQGFEGNINQHSVRLHLKDQIKGLKILPAYIVAYLNSNIGITLSNRGITGGTRPALDYEYIKTIKIPLPPIDIQNKIADEVKNRMLQAGKMRIEASQIIETAKQEVEKIILSSK